MALGPAIWSFLMPWPGEGGGGGLQLQYDMPRYVCWGFDHRPILKGIFSQKTYSYQRDPIHTNTHIRVYFKGRVYHLQRLFPIPTFCSCCIALR